MAAYYNEIDPVAAEWLRRLIRAGHIADGVVDERSIRDVQAEDLRGFRQVHFFAGIGVWSHALRRAGVSDEAEVWTGSCPCQPFSAAGKGLGKEDPRHLWPDMLRLIEAHRPRVVFGEQVAGKAGRAWFDDVSSDLEGGGYLAAGADFAACSVGAPHMRKRLYWVAYADGQHARGDGRASIGAEAASKGEGCQAGGGGHESRACGTVGGLAYADGAGPQGRVERWQRPSERPAGPGGLGYEGGSPTNGHWRNVDWLHCRDGKWRPVEPGSFPLVDGSPGSVGRLRAYGNAICAPQAEAFISSALEAIGDLRGLDEAVQLAA